MLPLPASSDSWDVAETIVQWIVLLVSLYPFVNYVLPSVPKIAVPFVFIIWLLFLIIISGVIMAMFVRPAAIDAGIDNGYVGLSFCFLGIIIPIVGWKFIELQINSQSE
jgi:hypothetical protein